MTEDACKLRHGIWLGGSKYEGPCSLVGRLESVCVRVRLAVDFTWALDDVDEDGEPDQGCWWRYGQMTSVLYTPLVKADTSISLGGVTFQVRTTDDPYITAQRLTDGSMYFGKDYSDQHWLGVSFWILGVIALMPCCVFFCVLKRAAKQKRQQVSGAKARANHSTSISAPPAPIAWLASSLTSLFVVLLARCIACTGWAP